MRFGYHDQPMSELEFNPLGALHLQCVSDIPDSFPSVNYQMITNQQYALANVHVSMIPTLHPRMRNILGDTSDRIACVGINEEFVK